jgi:hypothetical protein
LIGDLQSLSVKLTSGDFGQPGATYQLKAQGILDVVTIEVNVTDILGTINEGFGVNSFLPNWLTTAQKNVILAQHGGSVENYLATGVDKMKCQGSYYFSQPLLEVNSFTIQDAGIIDTKDPAKNSIIWFDNVTQSYDSNGLNILDGVGWDFFAIQFPAPDTVALFITRITTQPSPGIVPQYCIASLYRVGMAPVRWSIAPGDISIVGSNPWLSPASGETYFMDWTVTLANPAVSVVLQTRWDDQEVSLPDNQYKYEGLGEVTAGSVPGVTTITDGVVWLEIAANAL